jgi:hypothetical protein
MTLEEKLISSLHGDHRGFIYFNLLSILEINDPLFLRHLVDEYKKDKDSSEWFVHFHKSLRQCDVYQHVYASNSWLGNIKNTTKPEDVSGHLDSILYETISHDEKDLLYNKIKELFIKEKI